MINFRGVKEENRKCTADQLDGLPENADWVTKQGWALNDDERPKITMAMLVFLETAVLKVLGQAI